MTQKDQSCTHICKKFSLISGLIAFYLYAFDWVNESVGLTEGDGIVELLSILLPFRFLIALASVVSLFKPIPGIKRGLAAIFAAGAFFAIYTGGGQIIIAEEMGFSIGNPAALFSVLAGLFVMLSMPRVDLWKKVIVGLVLGILLGLELAGMDAAFYSEYTKILGKIFIDLIMMIVTPLIFFSLVSGINTISDTNSLSRVGKKALGAYIFTSVFAISVGIMLGEVIQPGVGFFETTGGEGAKAAAYDLPILLKTFLSIIPDNAIGAMAGTEMVKISAASGASPEAVSTIEHIKLTLKPNTIQTVFFAIFVGVALIVMGEQGKRVAHMCHDAAQLMFKIIGFIINLAPLAVFGLMAWVAATLGTDALYQLGKFVVATIIGMGIHYIFIVVVILFIMRLNPVQFIKKSIEYQMIAFSTTSSKATLATSMDVAERKMGVSKPITSFILPLGASVNMDGTAIYLGLSALFFAQAYEVPLEYYHYILIIFTSTIAAVGAAGYPGGSLVVMALVLGAIGVPLEGIALLIGVDRILDMFRTTINITSDVAITMFIDRTEGTFNKKIYDTPVEDIHDDPMHIEPLPGSRKSAVIAATPDIEPVSPKKTTKKKKAAKKKPAAKKKATTKKKTTKKKS